ncbi:hypothetical protein [Streptomyces sp. NBC_00568]|uniref:hypothetical protein n=1 Tax=Streptomyces sp. NBC_00568 TaxID=2975779 RepID=UPI00224E4C31|nr:hypothetical protein [Streptomyces sp. NBC_00568]MCX4993415.1 hypothetical protein [Streptomyces sp. NBC_00568]
MDNVKRIYRHSEQRLIPRRPCPDCKTPIRGRWVEHAGMTADVDPEGDVTWHCWGPTCTTGNNGF